jgi:hypothetical protein
MDRAERPIRRQYPPFGEVPAAVPGASELRLEIEGATASLTGFACSAFGLSATLRTAARVPDGVTTVYAFAEHRRVESAVDVWVTPSDSAGERGARTYAHLRGGGGGTNGTVHSASFDIWFPIDVAALSGDLTIEMVWPAHDTAVRTSIAGSSLREAVDRADVRFVSM